jgi:hypothetical protein
MNVVEMFLLGVNVVTLVGLAVVTQKLAKVQGALIATSRIIASMGQDLLKSIGKTDVDMGPALFEWMNRKTKVTPPRF